MKKKALRALVILFVVVFICLFFGKTIETLTTPKARFSYPTNGRMVSEVKIDTKLFFKEEVEEFVKLAEKYPVTINAVYFGVGNKVDKGDVVFDATINDYSKKQKDINDEIAKKTEELIDLDTKNTKFSTTSERNKLYNKYLLTSQKLIIARAQEKSRARLAKEEPNPSKWENEQKDFDLAEKAYKQLSRFTSSTLSDESFEYIKKRDAIINEIEQKEKDAEELDHAALVLGEIKAENSGIITWLEIKSGEEYNGNKAIYKLNPSDTPPVLRAILSENDEVPEAGDVAKVKTSWSSMQLALDATGKNKEGQRYADFKLSDEYISASNGLKALMGEEKISVTMTKRANRSSTIIPASALRQEGDQSFVYVVQWVDGGIMSSYNVCKKVNVTVIARNDESVGIAEDLYESIIDREDRPIKEKGRVLESK